MNVSSTSLTTSTGADTAVRPFRAEFAEEAIADLRRRIAAWRPPEREPVDDQSQGVQPARLAEAVPARAFGTRWG